ncbi:MAG TPA: alpha-amylase family protein [Thermoanaerobaculia bacterium]|nr:alpha-amylase family protein [Thermoanaerobaculia bacterium]
MIDLWYKDAVIYSLDVDAFQDSNGDGIGDFRGLTHRLDYLSSLGVTCLWLLPFYPTPDRDNGYDVKDYFGVDPRLGTLGDFVEFMRLARDRGIRVIADLVVNHTSDQHPWFQSARQSKDSAYRDWYVWSDTLPANAHEGMVFPGYQDSIWAWDDVAGAYYLHRFYVHQPDLNISNPAVREEICRIMGFWLELGVSGFRLDAAPFLIGLKKAGEPGDDQYAYLREFRDFLSWRRGDAILLAEANVSRDKVSQYFGDGAKIHMLFSFLVNQYYFLAMARQEAAPLIQGLQLPPVPPETGQWANFVRNHDELDLGRLTEEDRQLVFSKFAPDPGMQLYGRGIRRRLPPMLGNERCRLELAYSLMLSLPGTPVLRYGEEIAMGDDLSQPERESVRTAMQWADEPNGGFSTAPPGTLLRPVISEGEYGYERVNVNAQQRDSGSLLHWMVRLIRVRKQCPEVGWGAWEILETGDPAVFALQYRFRGATVITVHNLAARPASVRLGNGEKSPDGSGGPWVELLGDQPYALVDGDKAMELEPYGYRWFRVGGSPGSTQRR